ncbi:MAG: pyridoxamine 5'-phosphate oxidase family protein [Candidatus Peribacteria bacterium]|jgi:general stress protein 26|nr:pyridoxamine 5'-phosphate oxidase family protein [Candidatus Peribacteria bacterium]
METLSLSDLQYLEQFIDKSETCLISSIDIDGYPQTRAVTGIRTKDDGIKRFYFSTKTSSQKVQQFKKNPNACVYFYDPMRFIGIMCIGTMEISQRDEDKRKVRKEGDETYYPKGFNDPDFSVLLFTTKKIRRDNNLYIREFEID